MSTPTYDVIVIGGGINGAGIARDAAERGLQVYLTEKHDFAYGTTFRSTKLIHGGLRYLEHYEIGLVRESLRERENLLSQAPHLVRPIKFVLPIYEDSGYGYGKVKLGLLAYDLLSYDKSLQNHQAYTAEEILDLEPNLRTEHLKGGFVYFDCQVPFPERLCLENILLAKKAGAEVHNYTQVTEFIRDARRVFGIRTRDTLTGETTEVYGRYIINATGPWVDELLGLADPKTANKIGGTKGSHILLPRFPKGPKHALYVPAHQDSRPFFIIPWRQYYWVGTTDIRYENNLDAVQTSGEEIDYLLREVNFVIPGANISRDDILYCLSGVRPLPTTEDEREEAEITRRHMIFDHEEEGIARLISIIGGKLTTYRNLAEETVDYIFEKLGETTPVCQTDRRPLWGGGMKDIDQYIEKNTRIFGEKYGLEAEQIAYLISLYGCRVRHVLALTDDDPGLRERICPDNPDIKAQIVFSLREELPRTVADIYLRRMGLGTSACKGLNCAEPGAKLMGKHLKWSRKQIRQAVKRYRDEVQRLYSCG